MTRVAKGMRDKPREREGGGVGEGQKHRFDEEYKKGLIRWRREKDMKRGVREAWRQ